MRSCSRCYVAPPMTTATSLATVDALQGGQKRIILLDVVRSGDRQEHYAVAGDEKRLNNALGRAKDYHFVFLNAKAVGSAFQTIVKKGLGAFSGLRRAVG